MGLGTFAGLHGASADDLWAVGMDGATARVTGASGDSPSAKAYNSQTRNALYGVWAASPSDVWAVGFGGTIRHYTGDPLLWEVVPDIPEDMHLNAVFGSSASDIWAVARMPSSFTTTVHAGRGRRSEGSARAAPISPPSGRPARGTSGSAARGSFFRLEESHEAPCGSRGSVDRARGRCRVRRVRRRVQSASCGAGSVDSGRGRARSGCRQRRARPHARAPVQPGRLVRDVATRPGPRGERHLAILGPGLRHRGELHLRHQSPRMDERRFDVEIHRRQQSE